MVNSEWALVNPKDTFPDSRKDLSRHRNSILECTIHLGFSLVSKRVYRPGNHLYPQALLSKRQGAAYKQTNARIPLFSDKNQAGRR